MPDYGLILWWHECVANEHEPVSLSYIQILILALNHWLNPWRCNVRNQGSQPPLKIVEGLLLNLINIVVYEVKRIPECHIYIQDAALHILPSNHHTIHRLEGDGHLLTLWHQLPICHIKLPDPSRNVWASGFNKNLKLVEFKVLHTWGIGLPHHR